MECSTEEAHLRRTTAPPRGRTSARTWRCSRPCQEEASAPSSTCRASWPMLRACSESRTGTPGRGRACCASSLARRIGSRSTSTATARVGWCWAARTVRRTSRGPRYRPRPTSTGCWLALVDSGSSCLSLPADLFYGLFRWISPSLRECSFDLEGGDYADADADADADANASSTGITGRRCHLPRGADAAMLPALSFRVSQAGRLLTLPLEELLLPQQADDRREFCIR